MVPENTDTTAETSSDTPDTDNRSHAVLVTYQKYTDAEARVLGMLSSRGFHIDSYGTADGIDPNFAYLTILLEECDPRRFENAIKQIEKIVTVIDAQRRDLGKVTQNLHARTIGLSDDERHTLKKDHKANIHRAALFTVSQKGARRITRTLDKAGAKIARVRKAPVDEGSPRNDISLSVRIKNPSRDVESIVAEQGGEFRDMEYVRLNADVPHIRELAKYLRTEVRKKIEYMTISSPRASLKDDDSDNLVN